MKSLPLTERDKIIAYLQDDSGGQILSKKEQELLERYDYADNLIRSYKSDKKIVAMLVSKFKYSKITAYRDIKNAKYVHGSVCKVEKEYWRDLLIKSIIETMAMAKAKKDFKALAMCHANLYKAVGLDKDDSQAIPFEHLQQHIINITYSPNLLGVEPIENLEEVINELKKKRLKKNIDFDDVEIIPIDAANKGNSLQ